MTKNWTLMILTYVNRAPADLGGVLLTLDQPSCRQSHGPRDVILEVERVDDDPGHLVSMVSHPVFCGSSTHFVTKPTCSGTLRLLDNLQLVCPTISSTQVPN